MGTTTNKRKADDMSHEREEELKKEDLGVVPDEVAAAAAAAVAETDSPMQDAEDTIGDDDKDDDDGAGSASKRRFFPRVKHLLTAEWEPFLLGVLDALDEAGAPKSAAASHKLTNPWYKAFHVIYNGIARDCSIPHGKNRYHKFKDKIVELWQAIEAYSGGDLPLRPRALEQLDEYRQACATQAITPKKDPTIPNGAPKTPSAIPKIKPPTANKSLPPERNPIVDTRWEHLDEAAVLKSLPESLQKLMNIRHLVLEVGAGNKLAVEEQYDKLLQEYLMDVPETMDALYEKMLGLAFLCRYAQSSKERKDISDVYDRIVTEYLVGSNATFATV